MRNIEEGLIIAAKEGDQLAYAKLERMYRAVIRSRACRYFVPGGNRDDLIQEGRIGFWKAVRDYSTEKGRFSSFAELCVTRQILTAVKTATRKKHRPLNGYTSLDQARNKEEETGSLLETLTDLKACSVEDSFLKLEASGRIARRLAEKLSPFEARILDLRFERDYSYEEVAQHTGSHWKAVDNGIQRIRRKYDAVLMREVAN